MLLSDENGLSDGSIFLSVDSSGQSGECLQLEFD